METYKQQHKVAEFLASLLSLYINCYTQIPIELKRF